MEEKNRKLSRLINKNKTIPKLCAELGIPVSTVHKRIASGKSLEWAVENALKAKRKRDKFARLKAECERRGVDYQLIRHRVTRGWDWERAITTPKKPTAPTKKTLRVRNRQTNNVDKTLQEFLSLPVPPINT